LTSALAGDEWSASRPGSFTPGERAHGTPWIGGWVDPRAGLADVHYVYVRVLNYFYYWFPSTEVYFGTKLVINDYSFPDECYVPHKTIFTDPIPVLVVPFCAFFSSKYCVS
jgi:hypothetical protein